MFKQFRCSISNNRTDRHISGFIRFPEQIGMLYSSSVSLSIGLPLNSLPFFYTILVYYRHRYVRVSCILLYNITLFPRAYMPLRIEFIIFRAFRGFSRVFSWKLALFVIYEPARRRSWPVLSFYIEISNLFYRVVFNYWFTDWLMFESSVYLFPWFFVYVLLQMANLSFCSRASSRLGIE